MVYESGSSGDAKCLRYKIIVFVKRNIVLEACTDSRRSKTAMRLAKRNFHSFTLAERRPRISALVASLPRCYPSPRVLFLNSFFELIPSAHIGRINPRHLLSHPLDIFLAFTLPQYYPLQFSGKNTPPPASPHIFHVPSRLVDSLLLRTWRPKARRDPLSPSSIPSRAPSL